MRIKTSKAHTGDDGLGFVITNDRGYTIDCYVSDTPRFNVACGDRMFMLWLGLLSIEITL